MSIRIEKQGIDIAAARRPYKIQCADCETVFSFIEKDAEKSDDGAGFVQLAVHCPNCGRRCLAGHHDNRPPEEREARRGGFERPPEDG